MQSEELERVKTTCTDKVEQNTNMYDIKGEEKTSSMSENK